MPVAGGFEVPPHRGGGRVGVARGDGVDDVPVLAGAGGQVGGGEVQAVQVQMGVQAHDRRVQHRVAGGVGDPLGEQGRQLVEALHDVLAMPLPSEPEIGPSTLNIGLISGGYAPNVISDKAEADILIRLVGPSDETKKAILATVGDRADVAFSLDLPFVRMRKVGNLPTMIASFTTDIPALTNWGEPLLLGPGSIHVAHTPNEKIAKKELFEAVDLYVELATSLARSL